MFVNVNFSKSHIKLNSKVAGLNFHPRVHFQNAAEPIKSQGKTEFAHS